MTDLVQAFKNFSHNAIIHPLMAILPSKWGYRLHDAHARWCWKETRNEKKVIVMSIPQYRTLVQDE